jgi:hypothetical protein
LTCRFRNNGDRSDDFTVAFTFSLKAAPKFGVGGDAVHPSQLLGLLVSASEAMESKANRSLRFRINFRREVAAILEQLDAGEGRTEAHVKMPPETRFIQTRDLRRMEWPRKPIT